MLPVKHIWPRMFKVPKRHPTVLIVDDNRDLLSFFQRFFSDIGWSLIIAESARHARKLHPMNADIALIDYMLPDGNGVELGVQLRQNAPRMQVIVMTGSGLPPEEEAICEEHNFPILRKPFLASDVVRLIDGLFSRRVAQFEEILKLRWEDKFSARALKVFFCYSHRDEKMRDRLDAHLSTLKHMGIIQSWHDRKISPGKEFDKSIDRYLGTADLILLLISPDFLNSNYCYRIEMKRALARHRKQKAIVVPVILRPVDWERAPFAGLLAVPKDGKPITRFQNRDEGYLDAARGVRRVAEELSATIRRTKQ
jgi:DNA-binding response OmpR family regulator